MLPTMKEQPALAFSRPGRLPCDRLATGEPRLAGWTERRGCRRQTLVVGSAARVFCIPTEATPEN